MNAIALVALGVAIGAAAAFAGLGGGFLVVPLLIYVGFTPQRAVGTAFLAILIISVSAVVAHGRLTHVDWRAGLLLGAGGVIGAQVGARILQSVEAVVFYRLFAGILLGLAIWMFFRK